MRYLGLLSLVVIIGHATGDYVQPTRGPFNSLSYNYYGKPDVKR